MTSHVITYRCGHTRLYHPPAPVVGDEVWCLKCQMDTRVMLAPDEWRIRCESCPYSRAYGAARLLAEIGATKHRKRRPDHPVVLYNGKERVRTFDGRGAGLVRTDTEPLF